MNNNSNNNNNSNDNSKNNSCPGAIFVGVNCPGTRLCLFTDVLPLALEVFTYLRKLYLK